VALHPTQLYDSLVGFTIFAILLRLDRKALPAGNLFMVLVLLTSATRFLLDFVRTYDRTAFPIAAWPLTLNQLVTLMLFFWAVIRLARGRVAEAPARA
jgi:prolipoprotein diacylglyceryltransferase